MPRAGKFAIHHRLPATLSSNPPMKKRRPAKIGLVLTFAVSAVALTSVGLAQTVTESGAAEHQHLRNIKQLTFGGQNAEAYFSPDGKQLVFQSTRDVLKCDQIFTTNLDGTDQRMVSTGKGRTTCSYFFGDGKRILYSSTQLGGAECPPKPDYSRGYVWATYPSYDIFTANADGSHVRQLTKTPGYDAEATLSTDGKKIVFTSVRNGDLDIYTMDADGKHVKQLTHDIGYDGGPFFSPDGNLIVYRAHHPTTGQETADYQQLLKQNLIRPTYLEIWLMNADGSDKRQITELGAASFAPSFFPDGKRIVFSSNVGSTGGMGNFELYAVDLDGKNLERITFSDGFDGFPVFSPNGKKLVWVSGRNGKVPHETNVFIADWVP
jgi:TolB protein